MKEINRELQQWAYERRLNAPQVESSYESTSGSSGRMQAHIARFNSNKSDVSKDLRG